MQDKIAFFIIKIISFINEFTKMHPVHDGMSIKACNYDNVMIPSHHREQMNNYRNVYFKCEAYN